MSEQGTQTHSEARAITDEDIRRQTARIGVEIPQLNPFNEYASIDAIRHFAEGVGDDNPLYFSPEYAQQTRWQGVVAPPYFVDTMGVSRIKEIPPELREKGRGALGGVHTWYSGDTMRFYLPIHVGDRMWIRKYVADVKVKSSDFAGRTVQWVRRHEYVNQRGELVAVCDRLHISGGREKKKGERKKYSDITVQRWEPHQIEEIAAEYRNEKRRGADPRYWEDVQIGEALPRRLKGPLTVSDMIRFDMGRGSPYIKAHKFAYAARDKHPAAYPLNEELGIPDTVERVHWSEELVIKTGNPIVYDYGAQRIGWLCQLMTDWIGDDGFLTAMNVQLRQFNYMSDVTYCYGKVERKFEHNGQYIVHCELWGEDQRGRRTCQGWGEAALPTRQAGPVRLAVLPALPEMPPA